MKPWIHPQERRSRIYYSVLIVISIVASIAIPLMMLQDPTRDHVIISIVAPIIGIACVILGIKTLKKLPDEYRTDPESDTMA